MAEPAQVGGDLDAHEAGGGEPAESVRLHPVNFSALIIRLVLVHAGKRMHVLGPEKDALGPREYE